MGATGGEARHVEAPDHEEDTWLTAPKAFFRVEIADSGRPRRPDVSHIAVG